MKRNALATFFRRAVIAALPLAGTGCSCNTPIETNHVVDGGIPDAALISQFDGGPLIPTQLLCDQVCAPFFVPPDGASSIGGACEIADLGAGIVRCFGNGCTGRRPAGLRGARAPSRGDVLARWLAQAAHLEAASVPAFERLRDELLAHGAPAALVRAAERAILDEKRHARTTAALARHHGATPPSVELNGDLPQVRDLEAIALENAIEGCVRESWGALLAHWQARTAGDRAARALMASIAPDETRHAELAWAVARFVEPRLTRAARGRVRAVRHAALAEIEAAAAVEPPALLVVTAGLPPARAARSLVSAFVRELGNA